MRQFAEDLKAGIDFRTRQVLQALGAEAFHGERAHHSTVKEGALQDFAIDLAL
jgi:hypothetical protein